MLDWAGNAIWGVFMVWAFSPYFNAYQGHASKPRSVPKTPYTILGLAKTATLKEVKKAYRTLQLQYHPDKCTLDDDVCYEKSVEVTHAYERLKALLK